MDQNHATYGIIKLEYIQLLTTLIITYAIIFDKTNQINQMIIYSEHTYSNYLGFVPVVEDHRRKIAKLNEELHKTVAFCYLIILIDWFLTQKKKKKIGDFVNKNKNK